MTEETDKRLANSRQPKSPETDAVSLEEPIQRLISEGAAAIGLEKELSSANGLCFKVYLPPATGATVVEQCDTVEFNGETYNTDWIFDMDGPSFFGRVPIYSDFAIGEIQPGPAKTEEVEPVPVEAGWENLREFLHEREEMGHHE
ncbi:hypothetical protein [Natronosalvus amylolyticus]|uniref:hypothetical protein n=1 Tax=Natronosalvus amylolyticus TaxID=2961994 RepID=UPI0020CA1612|nr:hypothetical protein [Natronosalvus amylolyticus]